MLYKLRDYEGNAVLFFSGCGTHPDHDFIMIDPLKRVGFSVTECVTKTELAQMNALEKLASGVTAKSPAIFGLNQVLCGRRQSL